MMATSNHKSLLLATVGVAPPRKTIYEFTDGTQVSGLFSFTSLCHLLPADSKPDQVIVLVTKEAAGQWPEIEQEARRLGVNVRKVDIVGNELPNDAATFLEKAATEIPDNCQLILDVTQGLR